MINKKISEVQVRTENLKQHLLVESMKQEKKIIDELKSNEKSLIKNVSINPKCWNSNSLKISLDAINPGEIPVGSTLSMNIVITEQLK